MSSRPAFLSLLWEPVWELDGIWLALFYFHFMRVTMKAVQSGLKCTQSRGQRSGTFPDDPCDPDSVSWLTAEWRNDNKKWNVCVCARISLLYWTTKNLYTGAWASMIHLSINSSSHTVYTCTHRQEFSHFSPALLSVSCHNDHLGGIKWRAECKWSLSNTQLHIYGIKKTSARC